MPHTIPIQEQERLGLRDPKPANYVVPYHRHEISTPEQGVIDSALSAAGTVMNGGQLNHLAKSDDTALTNALASLFYSLAYSIAGACISAGLLLLAYFVLGGDEGIYALLFSWVPLFGDALTLFAGVMRANLLKFIILVAIGKGARYLLIAYTASAIAR